MGPVNKDLELRLGQVRVDSTVEVPIRFDLKKS